MKGENMRYKRCRICGAIIYDDFKGDVCDVCEDERSREREETDENGNEERSDSD